MLTRGSDLEEADGTLAQKDLESPDLRVCETTVAIVQHLRIDDNTTRFGGGLDTSLILCAPSVPSSGWDLSVAAPPDLRTALKEARGGTSWCTGCLRAWAHLLGYEDEEFDQMYAEALL